jgi:kinesin family protein C2/C3
MLAYRVVADAEDHENGPRQSSAPHARTSRASVAVASPVSSAASLKKPPIQASPAPPAAAAAAVARDGELAELDRVSVLAAALQRSNKNLELCHVALRSMLESREALKRHAQIKLDAAKRLRARDGSALRERLAQSRRQLETLRETVAQRATALAETARGLGAELCELRREAEALPTVARGWATQLSAALSKMCVADSYERKLRAMERRLADSEEALARERADREEADEVRKALHNRVQELRGNIRVLCRVRPLTTAERESGLALATYADANAKVVSALNHQAGRQNNFEFDGVLPPEASQEEVFAELEDLVTSAADGYHVCVLAYGQTGSGKTYTMEGSRETQGVAQRAFRRLFRVLKEREAHVEAQVSMSMVEIYNEHIFDLLHRAEKSRDVDAPLQTAHEIRQSEEKGVFVKGVDRVEVRSHQDVAALLAQGHAARAMAATGVHDRSSRSHCVLTIFVETRHVLTGTQYSGKLHLVDLAGSECVAKSEVTGQRLLETQHINRSLAAVGDVFLALARKQKHVPFRNSKLTHLLSDSLGGDSKAVVLVCVNPGEDSLAETLNTLNFGARVRTVELGPATPKKKLRQQL